MNPGDYFKTSSLRAHPHPGASPYRDMMSSQRLGSRAFYEGQKSDLSDASGDGENENIQNVSVPGRIRPPSNAESFALSVAAAHRATQPYPITWQSTTHSTHTVQEQNPVFANEQHKKALLSHNVEYVGRLGLPGDASSVSPKKLLTTASEAYEEYSWKEIPKPETVLESTTPTFAAGSESRTPVSAELAASVQQQLYETTTERLHSQEVALIGDPFLLDAQRHIKKDAQTRGCSPRVKTDDELHSKLADSNKSNDFRLSSPQGYFLKSPAIAGVYQTTHSTRMADPRHQLVPLEDANEKALPAPIPVENSGGADQPSSFAAAETATEATATAEAEAAATTTTTTHKEFHRAFDPASYQLPAFSHKKFVENPGIGGAPMKHP